MPRLHLLAPLLVAGLASAQGSATLEDALWRSAGVDVIVDPDEALLEGRIEPWLIDLRVRTALTGVRGRGDAARVVVGGHASEAARALVERTGVELSATGFEFAGRRYEGGTDRIVACFADPERSGLPVTVIFSNDIERLAAGLIRLPVGVHPGLEIWSEGEPVLVAELARDGSLVGEPTDRVPALLERLRRLSRVPTDELVLWAPPPREKGRLRRYVDRCLGAEAVAERWFGKDDGPRTGLYVHDDPRSVALFAGGATSVGGRIVAVNTEERRVHALLVPGLAHDGGAGCAAAAAVAIAGPPARSWMLDAAGAAASDWMRGASLRDTAAAWARSDPSWDVECLFSMESLRRGPGSRDAAMRALGFFYLASTLDAHELRRYWRDGVPQSLWATIAPSLERWLRRLAQERPGPARRDFAAEPLAGAFMVGGLARPGVRDVARTGYWHDALEQRLEDLYVAGANAVIFTFRPTLTQSEPLFGAPRFDASADDALELSYATRIARRVGLRVGIQLEPISGGLASWPDDAAQSIELVERFEERYAVRLGELGFAAEAAGAEFLLIGTSLRSLTRSRDAPTTNPGLRELLAARKAAWTRLVGRVRQVFAGPIGYTTRIGPLTEGDRSAWAEVSDLGFTDALDFVALHCVPTWDARPQSGREVERGFGELLTPALRLLDGKPFVLVAGAPSAREAWRFGTAVGAPDPSWQRMAADSFAGQCALLAKRPDWRGAMWWSVRAEPREDTLRDFDPLGPPVPGGPPALAAFRKFLGRAKGK